MNLGTLYGDALKDMMITHLKLDVAGTGLGLSLVKELVVLHNGNVWFESEVNKGTTFYVELPVEQPSFITDTFEMPTNWIQGINLIWQISWLQKMKRDIRELIAFTLQFAGHQITQAANGGRSGRVGSSSQTGFDYDGCAYAKDDGIRSL